MAQSAAEFSDRDCPLGPPIRLDGVTVIAFAVSQSNHLPDGSDPSRTRPKSRMTDVHS